MHSRGRLDRGRAGRGGWFANILRRSICARCVIGRISIGPGVVTPSRGAARFTPGRGVSGTRGLDHRHDAGLQGLGQVGPCFDHGGQIGVSSPSAPSGGTGRVEGCRAHRNGRSPGHDPRLRTRVYGIPPSGVNGGPTRIPGAIPPPGRGSMHPGGVVSQERAALTIATMPAFRASGRSGHASTTAARSGSSSGAGATTQTRVAQRVARRVREGPGTVGLGRDGGASWVCRKWLVSSGLDGQGRACSGSTGVGTRTPDLRIMRPPL